MGQLLALDQRQCVYLWNLAIATLSVSGMGWLALQTVRDSRPVLRYRIASLVTVVMLVCPFGLWGVSQLDVGAFAVAADDGPGTNQSGAAAGATASAAAGHDRHDVPADAADARNAGAIAHYLSPSAAGLPVASGLVAAVWIAGAMWASVRWLTAIRLCHRLRLSARRSRDPRLLTLVGLACDAAQLDLRVPVCTSSLAPGPLSLGVWRPLIVLGEGTAEALSDDELACVLTHEAAHVARGDAAVAWLQQLLLCTFWWNPLVRAIHRELCRAREQICDDYVVRARGGGDTLAAVLVKLAQWSLDKPPTPRPAAVFLHDALFMHDESPVGQRITRLTEGRTDMSSPLSPRASTSLFALAAGTLALAFVPVLRAESAPAVLQRGARGAAAEVPARLASADAEKSGAKRASATRLSHNDGTAEGKKSVAGSAEFISFTLPEEEAKVAAIRIHGSRYGLPQAPKEDFSIYFLNEDQSETIATEQAPYSKFNRGKESWVEIKFAKPITVPKEFWVGVNFNAERTKGVYVSVDQSTDGSHSRLGMPGAQLRPAGSGGDWMIEAVLAK